MTEWQPTDGSVAASRRRRAVAIVAATTLLIGLLSSPTIHWGDAQRIFWYASFWPDVPTDHHALRIGLLFPVRVLIGVFGPGEIAFITAGLLSTTVLTVGVFVAGRELFDTRVGIAAFLLVLFNPFLLESSAFLTAWLPLPDSASGGFIALGFASVSSGLRSSNARSRTLLVLGGALLGWGYLVREFVAVMFFALPFLAWARHRTLAALVPTATTMLVVLAAESTINALVHGQPAIRLLVAASHGGQLPEPVSTSDALLRLWQFGSLRPMGFVVPLSVALLLLGTLWTRQRMLVMCTVWFASFWIALTLLGGLLDPATPSLRTILVRYWFPAFVPAAVGAAAVLFSLSDRIREQYPRTTSLHLGGVLAFALFAPFAYLGVATISVEPDAQPWRELRAWLQEADPEQLVTDNRTRDVLAFYARTARGTPFWDGCVANYWQGAAQAPTNRGGPILVSRTSPPLPDAGSSEVLFESTDGSLVAYAAPDEGRSAERSEASNEGVNPPSRIRLCP